MIVPSARGRRSSSTQSGAISEDSKLLKVKLTPEERDITLSTNSPLVAQAVAKMENKGKTLQCALEYGVAKPVGK